MTPAPRHAASLVAVAAAQLNDELALIASAAREAATDDDDPRTTAALADIRASAQRLAWMAAVLLKWAQRNGGKACAATVERMVEG